MLSEIFPFGTLTDLGSPLAIKNKIGGLDNHNGVEKQPRVLGQG